MMTGVAVTIAAIPEDIFSTKVCNDIMMTDTQSAAYITFDTAINGIYSPALHGVGNHHHSK